jgi:glucose-1-phosphate thymidylyltransferase
MKVLILAAGYGTRLYPYTKNFPKPLLEVNKKPIIGYLADKLSVIPGISKIIVVTNARFFDNFMDWREGLKQRGKIKVFNDLTLTPKEKLGAIGDMDLVFKTEGFDDDFLVIGGDNFFKEPLDGFISYARKRKNAVTIGVCDIKDKKEARNFGVVSLDRMGLVKQFQEKPARPASSLIGMCLYYFPKGRNILIKKYLRDPKNPKDAAGSYIKWLSINTKVYGFVFKDSWFDIGRIDTYNKVKQITKGDK